MSVRGGSSGGSVGTKISGSGNSYFLEYAPTTLYVKKDFGFNAIKVTVSNDSTIPNDVTVSYDGATSDGVLKYGETKDFYTSGKPSLYVKSALGGTNVRLWAE